MQDITESGPSTPLTAGRYQIEDLVIDTWVRQVTRDGADLAIRGLSFDLLWALVRVAPHLVSFDALMEQVWPGLVIGPETVTQRVKILRQVLGDRAENPSYIFAVRGHGYRMPAAATRAAADFETSVMPVLATMPAAAAEPTSRGVGVPNRRWLLLAALAVVVTGSVWWALAHRTGHPQPHTPTAAAVLPSGSVAVMPFANLTGDPAKEYFGDGMAEEMINALGQVPGLKVPARTSSFAYKGRNLDVRQIGQDLGVNSILEGSVRSAGSRIRITAQLIDAHSGYQLWSQSYDRDSGDIFKLQDELAAAILTALQIDLKASSPIAAVQAPPTQNVEAYDLYLQGDAMMFVADHGLQRALERYQRAIAIDPKFARAYVGAGLAKFLLGITHQGDPIEDLAESTQFSNEALRLDPNLATAHSLIANVAFSQGRWQDAEREFSEASKLGEYDGVGHFSRGLILLFTGHLHGALGELKTGVELNPTHLQSIAFRSIAYSVLGDDSEALASAHLGAHLGDSGVALPYVSAMAALRAKHYAEAETFARGIVDPSLPDQERTAEVTRLVFAALADPSKQAAAVAARLRLYPKSATAKRGSQISSDVTSCLQSSYTYGLLGELDTVFALANQCLDSAVPGAINSVSYILLWQPELGKVRQDPRFAALAARLGFIEYWRKYGPPDDCELRSGRLVCH